MDIVLLLIGIAVGAGLGALALLLRRRGRAAELERELAGLKATLEIEKRGAEQRLEDLRKAEEQLKNAFKALSADALAASSESFLQLAAESLGKQQTEAAKELEKREQAVKSLVDPLNKSLADVRKQMEEIEKTRAQSFGSLAQQLATLATDQEKLRAETGNLVQALRKPAGRGQWGEIQLRRVVEMAGMLSHCDFDEQAQVSGEEGLRRPDLVVHLPGGKNVVVDAKTPLDAYLDALASEDESTRQTHLARHAGQVREQIAGLAKKSYWDQFETSPEFVVMFLPNESVFYAALEQDASLIEKGVDQKVILATPTTLIALLRAVHYGWQQEVLAENAQRISEQGRQLYERLATMATHFKDLGRKLDGAVDSYNSTLGSLESRVLVTARRFPELGVSRGKEMPALDGVERVARRPQSPELLGDSEDEPAEKADGASPADS